MEQIKLLDHLQTLLTLNGRYDKVISNLTKLNYLKSQKRRISLHSQDGYSIEDDSDAFQPAIDALIKQYTYEKEILEQDMRLDNMLVP